MKQHYIRLKENDVPDFFSVTFISFLFYCILFTMMVAVEFLFKKEFIDEYIVTGSFILILISTSIIVFKNKRWHKADAALELSKFTNRTKYLSYALIFTCIILFVLSMFLGKVE